MAQTRKTSPQAFECKDFDENKAKASESNDVPDMPFRFIDLPPELRNCIYEVAIPEAAVTTVNFRTYALVRTCREIREEALEIVGAKTKLIVETREHVQTWENFRLGLQSVRTQLPEQERDSAGRLFAFRLDPKLHFRAIEWRVMMKRVPFIYGQQPQAIGPECWSWVEVGSMEMAVDKQGAFEISEPRIPTPTGLLEEKYAEVALRWIEAEARSIVTDTKDSKGFTAGDLERVIETMRRNMWTGR